MADTPTTTPPPAAPEPADDSKLFEEMADESKEYYGGDEDDTSTEVSDSTNVEEGGDTTAAKPDDKASPDEVEPVKQQEQVVKKPDAEEVAAEKPDLSKIREGFIKEIAQQYQLTPEQNELMALDPNKVLPEMAARLHADIYEAVLRTIHVQLPDLVDAVSQRRTVNTDNVGQFYTSWPELKGQDQNVLGKIGEAYRKENPTASTEEAIEEIGHRAMRRFKLKREAETPIVARPQPFRSLAANRATTVTPAPRAPKSIFEEIAMEEE